MVDALCPSYELELELQVTDDGLCSAPPTAVPVHAGSAFPFGTAAEQPPPPPPPQEEEEGEHYEHYEHPQLAQRVPLQLVQVGPYVVNAGETIGELLLGSIMSFFLIFFFFFFFFLFTGPTGQIRQAIDPRVQPPRRLTARLVEADDVARFVSGEGRVQFALLSDPHPHLARVLDTIEPLDAATPGCVVLPAMPGGDMHTLVRRHGALPEAVARVYARQLLSAMAHAHERGIALRDLKLGKLMFADAAHTHLVIADLSGAEFVGPGGMVADQRGSPAYVAPEVLTRCPYNALQADMWTAGIILYVLLTGAFPFQDTADAGALFTQIVAGPIHLPDHLSPAARQLLRLLLCRRPHARPTSSQALGSAWLSGAADTEGCSAYDQLVPDLAACAA